MRDPKKNTKSPSDLNRYRPVLDTLEDRSLPGNSLLGISGITNPLSALASNKPKAAFTSPISGNSSKSKVTPKSTTGLSLLSSNSNASRSTSSAQAFAPIARSASSSTLSLPGSSASTSTPASADSSTIGVLQNIAGNNNAPASLNLGSNQSPAISVSSGDGGAALAAMVIGVASGSTSSSTTTTKAPVYDAETRARLAEYANAGTAGYLQNYATPDREISATQLAAADALKLQVPNLSYQLNTQFGRPTTIMNETGMLTGPQAGDPVTIARNYLTQIAPFLGVSQADLNSLTVDKNYGETVGSLATRVNYVYLQQQVSGIPVWSATSSVVMRGDGSIGLVNNAIFANVNESINTATPTITASQAAQAVAQNLGLAVTTPIVQRIVGSGATRKGTVSDGGFARQDINADLVYVPTGPGSTRLAWHMTVFLKNDYLFEFYVDATNGDVLLRVSQTHFDSYRVLPAPAKSPVQGTFAVVTNPADKLASPFGWHDTNGKAGAEYTITRGNNVAARARRDSSAPGSLGYLFPSGGATNTYNFTANFTLNPKTYQAAAAVQLFYNVNTLHDISYHYGFTEVAGNFQQNNYGRGNLTTGANDPVQAFAQDDADLGAANNAFMVTPPDGSSPEVHMFIFTLTGPNRDGDFDNVIPYHELGHGINGRLLNGGGQLGGIFSGPQANAMNEGWADFNGLFYTTGLAQANNFNGSTPTGNWVLGQPLNGLGIRRFAYSANKDINPLTYNDFDPSQVDVQFPPNPPFEPSLGPVDESHNGGEIWANTMWHMESNLVTKYGFSSNLATGTGGNNRAYQLYISGLKMTPPIPSMLEARDAIVAADNIIYGGADLAEIWTAFAARGMGVNANAGLFDLNADDPGWQSSGIIEDFTVPDGLVVTPPVPPAGGDGSADYLYEPNETSNKAIDLGAVTGLNTINNLQVKQPVAGKAQDRDWFKFTPTKAGTLTLTAEVEASAGDLDLRIYRSTNGSPSNLTEVAVGQGTKRQAGKNEVVTLAVGAGITYYFNVAGFNSGFGNYNLLLNAPV